MNDSHWRLLAVFGEPASAAVVAGLLRSEGIGVRIDADEPVPGLMKSFSVLVAESMFDKAQTLCSQAQLNDEEWAQYVADALGRDADDEEAGTST